MSLSVLLEKEGRWQVRHQAQLLQHITGKGPASAGAVYAEPYVIFCLSPCMQPTVFEGTSEQPMPDELEQLKEWVAYRVIGEATPAATPATLVV